MVPIYHPAAEVSHEVVREEKRIIRLEGWYHVRGTYYANAFDADRARRLEAERRVEERDLCLWCHKANAGAATVDAAGEKIHAVPCGQEFDEFTREQSPLPPPPLEQSLRKSLELGRVRDDDDVLWGEWIDSDTPNERYEYEPVKWRDLSCYERHTVERQPDGRLVGGYPF
jgi:hypothetical protein